MAFASSGSLFGQPKPATSTFGSFGANQQPQQQPATGTFGQSTQQPQQQTTTGFGGFGSTNNSLFSQKPAPASTTQPAVFRMNVPSERASVAPSHLQKYSSINNPSFTRTTKFNDLSEDYKTQFLQMEAITQGRIQLGVELKTRSIGEDALKNAESIRSLSADLSNSSSALHADAQLTRDLKAKLDQAVQDTIATMRIVDGFKNQQQAGNQLKQFTNFPLEYFSRITEETRERLKWMREVTDLIERKMAAMSASNGSSLTPLTISKTLHVQHQSFVALAGRTAELHEVLEDLKRHFRRIYRTRTGSVRDPFGSHDQNDPNELRISDLEVR